MRTEQNSFIMGIDEAGRGPLVGAVYAAAVILNPHAPLSGLADSKTLTENKRDALKPKIETNALAYAVASASAAEIDELNILQATMLAMRRAAEQCAKRFVLSGGDAALVQALVDGNRDPRLAFPTQCIVKGDSKIPAISAASILAKTARDYSMKQLAAQFPSYGFERHKGYGTAAHLQALRQYGALPEHRQSFAPVRAVPRATFLPIAALGECAA